MWWGFDIRLIPKYVCVEKRAPEISRDASEIILCQKYTNGNKHHFVSSVLWVIRQIPHLFTICYCSHYIVSYESKAMRRWIMQPISNLYASHFKLSRNQRWKRRMNENKTTRNYSTDNSFNSWTVTKKKWNMFRHNCCPTHDASSLFSCSVKQQMQIGNVSVNFRSLFIQAPNVLMLCLHLAYQAQGFRRLHFHG